MSDIDSRLRHPRRRANDAVTQPTLPQLGQVDLTSELLDEIAWRVSEQIRKSQAAATAAVTPPVTADDATAWSESENWPEPAAADPPPSPPSSNAALVIRLRRPLFRWPFRRRRHVATLAGYRLT
ncbi:MAG TPA: hypothetical protein VF491_14455 [Vicinamibacterales bacterium]